MTVRVPTHKDGKSLYWEFATDGYDVGLGLFFEWVEAEDTQVYRYNKTGRRILRYTDTINQGGEYSGIPIH